MKVNLGIWDKLTKLVVVLLFVAGVLAVSFWYFPLIQQNERMRKQVLKLEVQVKKEEEMNKHLKSAVDTSRSDPGTIERLAREKLGYAKPGEVVIRFEPPSTNQSRR